MHPYRQPYLANSERLSREGTAPVSPRVREIKQHLAREYARVPTAILEAMLRVAKTRLRPFFADPRYMEALRLLVRDRNRKFEK